MISRSGNVPRYHAGNACDVRSDLPCLGGMQTRSRLQRPSATLASAAFSAFRCGGSRKLSPRRSRARPPGVCRATETGEQVVCDSDCFIVRNDMMAYLRIDVDLERRTIGSSELRLVCPAPILQHPAFKHSQAGLPVYQRRLVDSVGVAQLEFGPGSLIGQTKCAIVSPFGQCATGKPSVYDLLVYTRMRGCRLNSHAATYGITEILLYLGRQAQIGRA